MGNMLPEGLMFFAFGPSQPKAKRKSHLRALCASSPALRGTGGEEERVSPIMNAIIVSDLHLGCRYFACNEFTRFFESIPQDFDIILNGDVLDNSRMHLPPSHQATLEMIALKSYDQRVIWIRGNHDNGCRPMGLGKIEFKTSHMLENRVLITHGDIFDQIMPKSLFFMKAFKLIHHMRVKLGANPVHVAAYAKRWAFLYQILLRNVMINAVRSASQNGLQAVACGHTHYPEDRVIDGVRYINTGSWTELPAYFIKITSQGIDLVRVNENGKPNG
jgi:UDP-2,3-diacylglucosamine pyrophosphatase LpxH